MRVDPDLRLWLEHVVVGPNTVADPSMGSLSPEAVMYMSGHRRTPSCGLLGEFRSRCQVAHHQEARDVHAEITGLGDVLGPRHRPRHSGWHPSTERTPRE